MTVELISIIDPTAAKRPTSGDIDAMDRVDLKTVNLFKRNQDIYIWDATGTGIILSQ